MCRSSHIPLEFPSLAEQVAKLGRAGEEASRVRATAIDNMVSRQPGWGKAPLELLYPVMD